ncbi:MAG: molybdenum cofactor guanylyltransferase MobA [Rhodoferax sp.]|jgi:molybdopterin-guanine dinucleotide biosynthesis protein A|uniref:molybdenum cofactor guanylyltransferase MobA n=1 Tax=Rhodoferax sp. TaxID=50421 RepID=UPI001B4D640E|nr:molybdenum cofactor guanylyltransferase MobA [Rhodoferax sp.]MBP8286216.1 molybdenum cofactor guanylyltransferase MobA [Rhodoferax sp.]MBP9149759.1 molybdenum cofactor guanylyltransferase MobA [Rhodoferax sp.]MBP9736823.1 molybdenum cofactor guanylyltransferase MobA [Rhodoferax sp.]
MIAAQEITALILAGGLGSRMGGIDKGLQDFKGTPLVWRILCRLRQSNSVGQYMINANRNLDDYQSMGVAVWPDSLTDFPGPLAGFLTGLTHCNTPYLLTVPCDTPLMPLDLATRLAEAMCTESADLAMAVAPELDTDGSLQLRPQPVFCLLKTSLADSLATYMAGGGRKVRGWTDLHRTTLVAFDRAGDDAMAFYNANTLAELQQLELNTP